MNDIITTTNDGPKLIETNYWATEASQKGYFYVSINEGCFRILVPKNREKTYLREMGTGDVVLITRGAWPEMGRQSAFEFLFEDSSGSPFTLHAGIEQCDRLPLDSDVDTIGKPPRWRCAIYTEGGKQFELPARYRVVSRLPYLKPWGK